MPSWISSANDVECHFPLQNIPFGVAKIAGRPAVCVTAIGDRVVDLAILEEAGVIRSNSPERVFNKPALNEFMRLGNAAWTAVRAELIDLFLDDKNPSLRTDTDLQTRAVFSTNDALMLLPFVVSEYTDFYAGKQHALNVGTMFRGAENALPPNWLHIPIGYNGRASTIVVSGTDIHRPLGQHKLPDEEMPGFGPSRRVDIELELGAVVGSGSEMGKPITTEQADEMIFGYVLLNDWSSRDIQAWEYQPLGPFQGKAFGTSISPWVVSRQALEPFRVSLPEREKQLLPYLAESRPGLYDISLEVTMQPASADEPTTICKTNYKNMYYSAAQQLTHHAIGGCQMNTGDLLGSGTISGPEKSQYGSLLELSWGGKEPFKLKTGETRTFIEDNDRLTLKGWAQCDEYIIGFGECTGRILPAVTAPE